MKTSDQFFIIFFTGKREGLSCNCFRAVNLTNLNLTQFNLTYLFKLDKPKKINDCDITYFIF